MFRHNSGSLKAGFLLLLVLVSVTGCFSPEQEAGLLPASPSVTDTPAPEATSLPVMPVLTTEPATPAITTVTPPLAATTTTATPVPVLPPLPDAAINARIVDARNRLGNLIDTNVADTVIIQTDRMQGCEVKKSRELAYLIDVSTGESVFIKGDYWSIKGELFTDKMRQDHEYIIIHTHPDVWETCAGSGITSLNTFSLEDLAATANMTCRGYHIKQLIAIADREYRIWPDREDGWKSDDEIILAIRKIETGSSRRGFAYYDTLQNRVVFDMDSLMPFLAKELGYHYTINNNVIS